MPENGPFTQLRMILLGPEQDHLRRLQQQLDDEGSRTEQVAKVLAEAVALRTARDHRLRTELQPLIEEALRLSVQKNPRILSDALFPIIGAAIRKATAAALQGLTEQLDQTLEKSLSLRGLQWRWEALRTGRPFAEVVLLRSMLYRVEQVFLIHRKNGLLLRHEIADHVEARDADLVSAMLTAIQDFVHDSFGSGDSDFLDTVQMGEFRLWIRHGPHALLAAVVRGVPHSALRTVLQTNLERIHEELGPELENYSGDASPFERAVPYLRACLLGQAPVAKERRSPWRTWAPILAILLLAIGALVFLVVRDRLRWKDFLSRLASEPGIVVTEAGKGAVRGLRDPAATDPVRLIPEGLQVQLHFEPFQSLDPKFAVFRALEAQHARVEGQRIFFDLGSSNVAPGAIETVAAELRRLFDLAGRTGRPVRVRILGRADREGASEFNARLALERATQVADAAAALGIPRDRLVPDSDPSYATDRSVSFEVEVSPSFTAPSVPGSAPR